MLRVIRQTDHAEHAGRIAEAWGSRGFPRAPGPLVEAARHHDEGWRSWTPRPRADGRPAGFLDLDAEEHLEIWRRSIGLAERRHPLQALVISRHALRLYRRHYFQEPHPPEEQALVFRFWEEEEARQQGWVERLEAGGEFGEQIRPEDLEAATTLLATWDQLSLMLCLGEEGVLERVPCRWGETDLRVVRLRESVVALDPFPFRGPLRLEVPSRQIAAAPYPDRKALEEALAQAPRIDLRHMLVPMQEHGTGRE